MNKGDIICWAKEAGLSHFYDSEGHCTGVTDASLVDADKERNDDRLVEILMPFAKIVDAKARAEEREACAKVCERYTDEDGGHFIDHEGHGYTIAEAIRARGEKC